MLRSRSKMMVSVALCAVCSFFSFWTPGSGANQLFQEGVKLFNSKNYKAATNQFEAALKTTPSDPNLLYYCAVSNQMSGNRARARQLFEYVSTNYQGSQVAAMSLSALKQWQNSGSSSSTTSSTGNIEDATPAPGTRTATVVTELAPSMEVKIPFERIGGGIYVETQVNGRPVRMHLDTGASSTLIGANKLQELGLGRPAALQQHKVGGVGERTDVKGWNQTCDLRVGSIYLKNFPITVQDHMDGDPLLGQTFLSNFFVTIDESNRQVVLRKKASKTLAATKTDTISVPFTRGPGGHMIVTAEINGKPYQMYFDTGADGISFTQNDLKRLRIELPDNARELTMQGVAGQTKAYEFTIDKLKLGTIVKEDIAAHVVERSDMDHPLLGQTFYGGYDYTIDQEARVINFKKQR